VSPLKLPPVIASLDQGLLEQHLRAAVVNSLQDAGARAAAQNRVPKAVVDLAETIASAALPERSALDRMGGLGASTLRAALVYELDAVLPRDPGCTGFDRVEALYEGLGAASALASLPFPQKRGVVPGACLATAKLAARVADTEILHSLAAGETGRRIENAWKTIEQAQAPCAGEATSASAPERTRGIDALIHAADVKSLAKALRERQSAPADAGVPPVDSSSEPPAAAGACLQALGAVDAIDPAIFDNWVQRGLADASPSALVRVLHDEPFPCEAGPSCDRAERVLGVFGQLATSGLQEATLRALVDDFASAWLQSSALPQGDDLLRGAVGALHNSVVVRDGVATIDPSIVLGSIAREYDLDSVGRPTLRTLLGPSPWLFELNGGIPSLDFGQGKVVADASGGYSTQRFGVIGRGAIDEYDISTSALHRDYTHALGALEGWWISGGDPRGFRAEARLTAEFDYYDTTSYPLPLDITRFFDFDSRVARVAALAGFHTGGPDDLVAFEMQLGGGVQYEDPDTTTFPGAQIAFQSEANFSAHGSARMLLRLRAIPRILSLRLRGGAEYFEISRSNLTLSGTTITISNQQESQLDGSARLFLDIDAASIVGFAPAAWGGADWLRESSANSTLVGVVGIGIIRRGW
jgi:hypothetical protein